MIFGGSEGGIPAYYDTRSLTAKGYPCFIVGYFKTENTPNYFEMIPLEYFEDAIKHAYRLVFFLVVITAMTAYQNADLSGV